MRRNVSSDTYSSYPSLRLPGYELSTLSDSNNNSIIIISSIKRDMRDAVMLGRYCFDVCQSFERVGVFPQ